MCISVIETALIPKMFTLYNTSSYSLNCCWAKWVQANDSKSLNNIRNQKYSQSFSTSTKTWPMPWTSMKVLQSFLFAPFLRVMETQLVTVVSFLQSSLPSAQALSQLHDIHDSTDLSNALAVCSPVRLPDHMRRLTVTSPEGVGKILLCKFSSTLP